MSQPENYDLLLEKINVFIRKYHYNNLLRGLLFLASGFLIGYVVITLSEYFGNFNTVPRTILFYFFILLNLSLFFWLVIPPLLAMLKLGKTLDHNQAAEIIGKHFTNVNDKLLNTLQLKRQALENPEHRELLEASINQRIETLQPVSFPSAVNLRENNKYLKWVIPPAAVICILAFAAPSILTDSTNRLIHHDKYFAPKAPFQFRILNEDLSAVQGQDLKLDIKLSGDKLPADVYIETGNTTFKLDKDNISRFHYTFNNLQKSITFRLSGNGFSSAPYTVKVGLKPVLLHFDAELTYPAYLRKQRETITNAGDLTIPAGTVVSWKFSTQNASGLAFDIKGRKFVLNRQFDNVFSHAERIVSTASYSLTPLNSAINTSDSVSYKINVIADQLPSIQVEEKPDSVSMNAFYFNGQVADDHGFSSLNFCYRVGDNKKDLRRIPVKAALNGSEAAFFYFWDTRSLKTPPGETVTYFFEVSDNDGVNGPKTTRSVERTLNMPDAAVLAQQLNNGTQAVKQKIQSAVKMAGQIEKSAQKLNESLLEKNNLSFDEKKQVEELLQKKNDLDALVKEIQAENKKNLYNRQQNQQQTDELMEMQKQIENLLNNVLDDKTREMLQKLQQMLQDSQKDGTRDELSKMQNDNKSMKKELDRILELYKKLDFEQKVNQTVNQLNQLAGEQQKLAEQTKKAGNTSQDLQQQQKLNQQFDEIKKQLSDLEKMNQQNGNKQDFKNPQAEQQEIATNMQQSTDALKNNDRQKASDVQQQAANKMQQLAKKMQDDDAEGQESNNAVNARQLRELLKSLVNSSFTQEKIMQSLKGISSQDPNYTTLAQKQKDVKDNLKTAEDSLYALSRRIPQIQSVVNKEISAINEHIDQALDNMGERQTAVANRNQQFAMTSMNNLALMLTEALDQLQKQKSKSGKGKGNQQSLSQLSKMQQQLNQNMQQAREQMQKKGNQPQGKSGQNGMSEQFAKMARQQQLIRQSLQQYNRENNKDGRNGLGDLDKISKEMEQTENDLVNKRITDDALKRQQQIQTRLLEADKAEQEREQDQKRESKAGKELPPGYIKALQNYEALKAKQTERLRTAPPALNLYYKQKIKHYFDQLNAK
ncbi:hypothetical protein FPZ42_05575 [Mucilaginibacter achroorhodeus]|uniref:ATPase n=1 Tax=Mucilaginibacter achroorhodeus TaxID=2599294 RepID=A0A563UBE5_9SPHI|nr:DUF4175 family protein [Mucilaginibacter achroorhodeus]TWR28675.1 hypothetical protein FPZ42_05575 [Mucilaginibacter achroorhodeus]